MLLKDKIALITGAGSGIGAAIAQAYADSGAHLVLADLNGDALETTRARCEAQGVQVRTAVVDVTDSDATKTVIDDCVAELGRLDILVNAAGMLTEAPLIDMDPALWHQMISVDLTSVFLSCRWATPHMVAQGSGRIINIASQLGIKGGESLVHYSAAKAGVIGLTKALAREMAPHGVLVNAIAPGPVETPLLAGITEEWRAAKQAELPLRRFGTVEEIAPTAVLLASEPGGNLYVGQVLGPNSGDVMP
ncbi:SDR family NAD(P)-dependent oxidoreductase [Gordonia hydrophobica]|uniref:3-oxoacyl-[acyl-carrier-protein] reductase MabA n=1 Tax=Gordonia hydrophobica TaxID=40516 RepID=A0ABZ2U4U0_9ACTN|nr:SDR family NAD(P)-dependent oxidoreductase [Gordonia hydrophobica]MBM7368262.1 3-oxoacyl-[acyl-carrier protein] reductase [Gordonia hydrophobica]